MLIILSTQTRRVHNTMPKATRAVTRVKIDKQGMEIKTTKIVRASVTHRIGGRKSTVSAKQLSTTDLQDRLEKASNRDKTMIVNELARRGVDVTPAATTENFQDVI